LKKMENKCEVYKSTDYIGTNWKDGTLICGAETYKTLYNTSYCRPCWQEIQDIKTLERCYNKKISRLKKENSNDKKTN
jgi:hypothetical protein